MNNNLTSERAILGQYNTTSYITIADPYLKKNQPLSRCSTFTSNSFTNSRVVSQTQEEAISYRARSPWPFEGHYVCQGLPMALRGNFSRGDLSTTVLSSWLRIIGRQVQDTADVHKDSTISLTEEGILIFRCAPTRRV